MQNLAKRDLGQLFMVGLPTTELDSSTLELIEKFRSFRETDESN